MLTASKGNEIDAAEYKDILCGTTEPGRRWRLVFTGNKVRLPVDIMLKYRSFVANEL